jgi:hypothetical protein
MIFHVTSMAIIPDVSASPVARGDIHVDATGDAVDGADGEIRAVRDADCATIHADPIY